MGLKRWEGEKMTRKVIERSEKLLAKKYANGIS